MLDSLESELPYLRTLNPSICVEIGSGSGVIISALSKSLPNSHCIAIDLNPYATVATKRTAEVNNATVDVINMNLLDSLITNSIDVLIFNPPYVPTPTLDDNETNLDKNLIKSWSGGIDGREVIDKVLKDLNRILTMTGVFYLLLVKENRPSDIISELKHKQFNGIIIMERRVRGEHLFVLKIVRL